MAVRSGKLGFTLMEMLVALTLSSIVMMALFSMFNGVVDVASHVKFEEGIAYEQGVFESILSGDLQSIYSTDDDDFRFIGKSGSFLGVDGEFLTFCTSASLNSFGAKASFSLNSVQYILKGGRDSRDLYRREKAHCGVVGEWEWVETLLLRDVSELELEYLNSEDNSFTTQWDGLKGRLPAALQIVVVHSGGREYRFSVDVGVRTFVLENQ